MPLVSIFSPTYNHCKYIKQCLDGLVFQKTKFQFEIFVQDDASSDGTAKIILDFAKEYDFIIPIVHSENIYSKGKSINDFFFRNAKGKYIAICEGDDYWTDPLKLQKQVDFLEANLDYVLTFHEVEKISPSGESLNQLVLGEGRWKDLSQEELIAGDLVPSVSVVFRKECIQDFLNAQEPVKNVDTFLFALLGQYGKAHFHADIQPAKYRIHGGGVWTGIDLKSKKEALIHTFETLRKVIKSEKKQIVNNVLFDKYLDQFLNLDYPLATKIKLYFRLWKFGISNGLSEYLVKLHLQFVRKFYKKFIHG